MKFGFLAAGAALLALSIGGCRGGEQSAQKSPIDAARLSEHIRVLSDDKLEGRGPGTAGETGTVDYLTAELKALGLEPAGENGGYTQSVPLNRYQASNVKMTLSLNGQARSLTQGEEAVVQTKRPAPHVSVAEAPMVFVGYGVKAPERNWDDFKGMDLKGKVMVVLVNDPDFENPQSQVFGGKAMTYYGRWTYKFEEAARQGAAGVLIVHETAPASYGWATVKNSNANAQFDVVRQDPAKDHPPFQGWMQRDLAVGLFKACGLDFEAQKAAAKTAAFKPQSLDCARFSTEFDVQSEQIVSKNVIARLPGKTRPEETVFYTAHWDHLGVGEPDATGDRIFNGAVDNASGTGGVLEIARAFTKGERPDRSVVFLFVTAEEKGLLGSLYYAQHPLFPPEKTVGVINIDALDATGPAKDIAVSGGGQVTLEDDLDRLAKARGRHLSPDPDPGAGSFYRSDHFSFAKIGVPAISINSGRDLVNGGVEAGRAWSDEYTDKRYHQPADEWSKDMDLSGQIEDLGLAYEMGRELAATARWPDWKPTSEFKPIRDATASVRQAK